MKFTLVFIQACLCIFFVLNQSSCQYDSIEELYPASVCDTTDTVSYSLHMAPLFSSTCGAFNTSCHVTGSTGGSTVVFDSYSSVVATDTALILASIRHTPGAKPMPRNAAQLDDCTIYKIEKWMKAGSPNN